METPNLLVGTQFCSGLIMEPISEVGEHGRLVVRDAATGAVSTFNQKYYRQDITEIKWRSERHGIRREGTGETD